MLTLDLKLSKSILKMTERNRWFLTRNIYRRKEMSDMLDMTFIQLSNI